VEKHVAAAFVRGSTLLMVQRPATGMLAGTWELPSAIGTELEVVSERVGARVASERVLGVSRHKFSHVTWETTVHLARAEGEPVGRWVDLAGVGEIPVSTCARKMVGVARKAV
jgi:adenine-specific DNA glycosylase